MRLVHAFEAMASLRLDDGKGMFLLAATFAVLVSNCVYEVLVRLAWLMVLLPQSVVRGLQFNKCSC